MRIIMSVKDDVLKILSENKGKHYSGEEIAKELNVSRNSVWKAVNALKKSGYKIDGINNKGYCMAADNDVLSKINIEKYLNNELRQLVNLEVRESVDSTNNQMKLCASEGGMEWEILIAEEQTNGRGRKNRVFFSPAKTGIYMSILLRPKMEVKDALFITTMAAVAVTEAIENVTGEKTEIKWVNDVYCNDKKICGILTEASMDLENGMLEYAVLGIGINVMVPENGFPKEITAIADALYSFDRVVFDVKSRITAEVINRIYYYYTNLPKHDFMHVYRDKSMLIGKYVYITDDESKNEQYVIDVDDDASLVVKDKSGAVRKLSSGEVSVKKIN